MANLKMRIIGQELKNKLENYFNTRIEISYCNEDYEKNKGFIVDIYSNEYDYKKVNLSYLEHRSTANEYFELVKYAIAEGKVHIYEASADEIYIGKILQEMEVENLYILDGVLYAKNDPDGVSLRDIDYISLDRINSILEIWNGEKFEVNLLDETIRFLDNNYDKEEDPELVPVPFNKERDLKELQDCLEEINKISKIKNQLEYKIINDAIIDISYRFKETNIICNINEIDKFILDTENNDNITLILKLKDKDSNKEIDTWFLGVHGAEC